MTLALQCRKPGNLIKLSLNHSLLSNTVRKLNVLTRKGLDSRQHCWHRSANGPEGQKPKCGEHLHRHRRWFTLPPFSGIISGWLHWPLLFILEAFIDLVYEMASVASRRNAVRFELQEDLEMDQLQFNRNIVQKELGLTPAQLDYVFALPGRKTFEVIFSSFAFFGQCLERFHQKKDNNPRLDKVLLTRLSEREPKTVTVMMFSEKVTTEDICTWLSFHCSVLRSMELGDEDGIRTGARRFYVYLRREEVSGRPHYLPFTIQLRPIRGHIVYAGQPKTCKKCGSSSHLAANCNAVICRNCKSPMRCNLCSSTTHTFRGCPQSYAN
uniref:CCHC-type domain-containing protein n=1 Tax=Sparus aurata TaxID=8175 RepID=A0A671YFT8_SPAAU